MKLFWRVIAVGFLLVSAVMEVYGHDEATAILCALYGVAALLIAIDSRRESGW
jgi:hypothetical protein